MLIRTTTPRLIENIVVREAVHEDARSVLDTIRTAQNEPDCALGSSFNELVETEAQETHLIQKVNQNPNALMLVAEAISLSQTVGMLLCYNPPQPTKRHVVRLGACVRKEWRGRGLGTRLIQEAIRWAERHKSIRRMEAEILANDSNALAVYSHLGFRVEGRAIGAVYIDDVYVDTYSMALYLTKAD